MKLIRNSLICCHVSFLLSAIVQNPVIASQTNKFLVQNEVNQANSRSSSLTTSTLTKNNYQQVSISAKDLLAQNGITEVAGIQLNQTDEGLEIILETSMGGQLVPLILPEGNNLAIDLLDATLALPVGNEFREINPTEGIAEVTLTQIDESSLRLTITGKNQTPSAEVIPSQQNLVLSINPQGNTAQQTPDEEIEIIATGEAEDNGYNPTDSSTAIGIETPIKDTPLSIQVVPQEVIEDRNVRELGNALETVGGVVEAGGRGASIFGPNFKIRGFDVGDGLFRDGISTNTLAPLSTNDLERVEVLKGPASVLFGQGEPGGIINLVTKKPLSEPFYEASFSAGNFDTYQSALDLSGPLNELKTVKYRLNLSYENYESFRDFVNGERFLVSPALTWDISKNTSIDFYGQYTSDRETIDSGIPALDDGIVDVPRKRFLDEDFGEFEQEQFRIGYRFNHRFDDTWSIRHALEYNEYEPSRYGVLFDEFDEITGELTRLEYGTEERFQRFFTNGEAISEFDTGSLKHQVLFGVEYLSNVDRQAFEFSDPFPERKPGQSRTGFPSVRE